MLNRLIWVYLYRERHWIHHVSVGLIPSLFFFPDVLSAGNDSVSDLLSNSSLLSAGKSRLWLSSLCKAHTLHISASQEGEKNEFQFCCESFMIESLKLECEESVGRWTLFLLPKELPGYKQTNGFFLIKLIWRRRLWSLLSEVVLKSHSFSKLSST